VYDGGMLRICVLALLFVSRIAAADDLTAADLEDDAKRVDQRTLPSYDHALEGRDIFATLHDTVYHPAFKELKAARAKYDAARAAYKKALDAKDIPKATKELKSLQDAGELVTDKLAVYVTSSSGAVEKIQIGLGVFAFLICGIGVLIYRRLKKRKG
jgi:hypothetical protein